MKWDDRVIDHLPDFQMSDPYVTREMRIRDLFTHRSGLALGAGDLMYFPPSDLSRAEIVRRLRFVPLAYSFRERYAYDNILYIVAGEVIARVSGMPWERFVKGRILDPLAMKVLQGEFGEGDRVVIDAEGASLVFTKRAPAPVH